MKILFVSEFFSPHRGGSELYAQELLRSLKLLHPDLQPDVLCYNTEDAPLEQEIEGIRVFRVKCFRLLKDQFYLPNPTHLLAVLRRLSQKNYKIVICQVRFFDPAWWSWIYARLIGARSVFIEHGTGYVEHPLWAVRLFSRVIDKTIASFSLRKYDRVVVISKATRKFVQEELGIKKTTLVYGGIDEPPPSSLRGPRRTFPKIKEPISSDTLVISFIGRLIWAKGPQFLLEAFHEFIESADSRAVLLFGGDGPLLRELESRSGELNLQDRVYFLGNLSRGEVARLLSSSDVFVNPSLNEGLPRTVIEAGAAGCFVIATDVGATREIIEDHRTGLLVPKGNPKSLVEALEWFDNHKKISKIMAIRLSEEVRRKFSWKVLGRDFWSKVLTSG